MRFLMIFVSFLFGFVNMANALPAASAMTEHAKVTLVSEAMAVTPGQPFHVSIDFELEDHWHIYWRNPGDSGLAPDIDWDVPSGFSIGAIQWPAPKRIKAAGLVNYGYEGSPGLIQKMIPPQGLEGLELTQGGNEIILEAELSWLICKEVCIPESAELALTLPISEKPLINEDFASRFEGLPKAMEGEAFYQVKEDKIYLKLPKATSKQAYFYPEVEGIIDHAATQKHALVENETLLAMPKGTIKFEGPLGGVLVDGGGAYQLTAKTAIFDVPGSLESELPEGAGLTLGVAILLALAGGLLLNAMPCVFPVLSLKALSIARKAEQHPAKVRKQGLAYLFGVVASFIVLGALLLFLRSIGEEIGWGFQLQSPVFVSAMIVLFFLMGLSLVGMFNLPAFFGHQAQEAEQQDSLKGSFLTGVLAVLVATPCAVPFMAPAVGYAFSQPLVITFTIMVTLGVGLALPYLLIAYLPALHQKLPKPGPWMNRFKELMAFPLFGFIAWLLWVLVQQVSVDVLAIVLTLLVLLPFLIWLKRRSFYILAVIISFVSLWNIHVMSDQRYEDAYKALSEPFSLERLAELRAEGKPVFVNATAAWCITCKVNERVALRDEAIAEAFADKGITYLVADWTNRDNEITQWLERYERSGVPLYVFYPEGGGESIILPQLLTPSIVLESIEGESK